MYEIGLGRLSIGRLTEVVVWAGLTVHLYNRNLRKKIIFKWSLLILNTFLYFFNVNEHLPVLFVELARSGSFVDKELLAWAFLQSHKLNLSYCLKSSLLLVFSFLFVCMVGQTQMHPSSISPLRLFQGIICNILSVNPLIYRGLGFLKNHRRGIKIFL